MPSVVKGMAGSGAAGVSDQLIDEDLQGLMADRGLPRIPFDLLSDIGDHLMDYIRGSAKRLAGILQEEESRQV